MKKPQMKQVKEAIAWFIASPLLGLAFYVLIGFIIYWNAPWSNADTLEQRQQALKEKQRIEQLYEEFGK